MRKYAVIIAISIAVGTIIALERIRPIDQPGSFHQIDEVDSYDGCRILEYAKGNDAHSSLGCKDLTIRQACARIEEQLPPKVLALPQRSQEQVL